MKLPNGTHAIVEHEKLFDYVLNPDHPVGKHHAYLFHRLLGITRENSTILRKALLKAAADGEVESTASNPYGMKYRMRMNLTGPLGTKNVVSVWVINIGSISLLHALWSEPCLENMTS